MKIKNYLPELVNLGNLYICIDDKLLTIIRSAYSDIKSSISAKRFVKRSGLSKATLTAVMRGEVLPSLKLIAKLDTNVTWNLWDIVYEHIEKMRGKTNSNIVNVPKVLTEDLAYLLGSFGDGSLVHYSYVYELEYGQKNPQWLEQVIKPKITNVFGIEVKVKKRKNGSFVIRKRSKVIYMVLKNLLSYKNNYLTTPEIILNAPFELQKHYIAGFYDAEGRKSLKDMNFYQQWCKNKDCPSLEEIRNILIKRGIKTKYYKLKPQNNAFLFTLHVEVETKGRFLKEIPLQHPSLVKLF